MRPVRLTPFVVVLLALVLLLPSSSALAQSAPPDAPQLPDIAPVAVDATTTALLVLEINSSVCPPRPACMASVPAISRLLARARAANAFVVYSTTAGADILPDLAPRANDPV